MTEMYIVQTKVMAQVNKMGLNKSGDFYEALSKQVEDIIKKAGQRCQSNGRKTIRAGDL